MRATRSPDGHISLHEVPERATLLMVDDVESPFGRLAIAIHVQLPDGRIVAVPIRSEDAPARKMPGDGK